MFGFIVNTAKAATAIEWFTSGVLFGISAYGATKEAKKNSRKS